MKSISAQLPTDRLKENKSTWKFILSELKPKGKIFTPFNMISAPVIVLGVILIVIRFVNGIGSVTNLTQEVPWGLWIGFDVITGVAFAGGAYVVTFMVYIIERDGFLGSWLIQKSGRYFVH